MHYTNISTLKIPLPPNANGYTFAIERITPLTDTIKSFYPPGHCVIGVDFDNDLKIFVIEIKTGVNP